MPKQIAEISLYTIVFITLASGALKISPEMLQFHAHAIHAGMRLKCKIWLLHFTSIYYVY